MKAKIIALVLAVGLGMAGIAATAQAATEAASECTHPNRTRGTVIKESRNYYNPTFHQIVYIVKYSCKDCKDTFDVWEEELERHDYEQTYYDDGSVYSRCTGCDDAYFW